jgi:hypothetical protein
VSIVLRGEEALGVVSNHEAYPTTPALSFETLGFAELLRMRR